MATTSNRTKRFVVKIGGSLLSQSDFAYRWRAWFDQAEEGVYLAVVGGGTIVDGLRSIDDRLKLDPEFVHWLAIDLMRSTMEIALSQLDGATLISEERDLRDLFESPAHSAANKSLANGKRLFVVAPQTFYSRQPLAWGNERARALRECLPRTWSTTSDSMAVLLAELISADECILLKSCEVNQYENLVQAELAGVLDTISSYQPSTPIQLQRLI